jgi:hypothetical protein
LTVPGILLDSKGVLRRSVVLEVIEEIDLVGEVLVTIGWRELLDREVAGVGGTFDLETDSVGLFACEEIFFVDTASLIVALTVAFDLEANEEALIVFEASVGVETAPERVSFIEPVKVLVLGGVLCDEVTEEFLWTNVSDEITLPESDARYVKTAVCVDKTAPIDAVAEVLLFPRSVFWLVVELLWGWDTEDEDRWVDLDTRDVGILEMVAMMLEDDVFVLLGRRWLFEVADTLPLCTRDVGTIETLALVLEERVVLVFGRRGSLLVADPVLLLRRVLCVTGLWLVIWEVISVEDHE